MVACEESASGAAFVWIGEGELKPSELLTA